MAILTAIATSDNAPQDRSRQMSNDAGVHWKHSLQRFVKLLKLLECDNAELKVRSEGASGGLTNANCVNYILLECRSNTVEFTFFACHRRSQFSS